MPDRGEPPRPPRLAAQVRRERLHRQLIQARLHDLQQRPDRPLGKPGIGPRIDSGRRGDRIADEPPRARELDVCADAEDVREALRQPPLHAAGGDRNDVQRERVPGCATEQAGMRLDEAVGSFCAMDLEHRQNI